MNLFATLYNGSLLPDVATAGSSGFSDNFFWFVNTYPMATFYVAIALLLIILLLLLRSRRARRDVRVYQNDGGFAVVSQRALRHLIYIACEDAGLASSPKICFREVKGRINVEVGLKLFQSQRLSEVHELLRQRIRAAVEETHGIAVGDVSVKILGFRKDAYEHETHEDEQQEQPVVVRAAPGEASAASLYEEPITSETVADTESAAEGTDSDADTVQSEPKKRRFGFFGRKKESADDNLFVSEAQDVDASFADGESTAKHDSATSEDGGEKPAR